jgi:hypothetical protein
LFGQYDGFQGRRIDEDEIQTQVKSKRRTQQIWAGRAASSTKFTESHFIQYGHQFTPLAVGVVFSNHLEYAREYSIAVAPPVAV